MASQFIMAVQKKLSAVVKEVVSEIFFDLCRLFKNKRSAYYLGERSIQFSCDSSRWEASQKKCCRGLLACFLPSDDYAIKMDQITAKSKARVVPMIEYYPVVAVAVTAAPSNLQYTGCSASSSVSAMSYQDYYSYSDGETTESIISVGYEKEIDTLAENFINKFREELRMQKFADKVERI